MQTIKLTALTQGKNNPSARFRIRKLIPELLKHNIKTTELYAKHGSYPPFGIRERLIWAPKSIYDAFYRSITANSSSEVIFLQREMVSTLLTAETIINKPIILDVDDAIFLHKRKWVINYLAKKSAHIICGNEYLANHFEKLKSVTIIPTAVDTDYYSPAHEELANRTEQFIIGWSGSSSGLKYLYNIEKSLLAILNKFQNTKLAIISDQPPKFQKIQKNRIKFIPWSPQNEVHELQNFTIGIMPLDNNEWSLGKCSYKMLTYMACGKPVVVSNIGMNKSILLMDEIGFGATTQEDWFDSISMLLENENLRKNMGKNGRRVTVNSFSLDVITPKVAEVIKHSLLTRK